MKQPKMKGPYDVSRLVINEKPLMLDDIRKILAWQTASVTRLFAGLIPATEITEIYQYIIKWESITTGTPWDKRVECIPTGYAAIQEALQWVEDEYFDLEYHLENIYEKCFINPHKIIILKLAPEHDQLAEKIAAYIEELGTPTYGITGERYVSNRPLITRRENRLK